MAKIKFRKQFFKNSGIMTFTGFTFLVIAGVLNTKITKPTLILSKQETALNFDKDLLTFLSAGNKRLITDLLWIQTLLESDVEHYKKKDLNNWLFLRFNTIAHLDPKFYSNYLFGGQFLAIIKDDLEGANVIYDKGLSIFPEDYSLNYHAGFLNYFEKGDFEKGLLYLDKIKNHPRAPLFLISIVNKLRVSTGMDLTEVFQLVKHNYETTKDDHLKKRIESDLYAIKAEIDLECLNQQRRNCEQRDLYGVPYVKKNNIYTTSKEFKPFRILSRQKK